MNLAVSIPCALRLGLVGVYIGTVASRLVFVVSRPATTYRFLFGASPCAYFRDMAAYLVVVLGAALLCRVLAVPLLAEPTVGALLGAAAVCLAATNLVFWAVFGRSEAFRSVVRRLAARGWRGAAEGGGRP